MSLLTKKRDYVRRRT